MNGRVSLRIVLAIVATVGLATLSYMIERGAVPQTEQAAILAPPLNEQVSGAILLPSKLSIPSVGIDAPIVAVGQTTKGAMKVPENAHTVGWYAYGPKPGEKGSAVLAGHLNTAHVKRGVFWKLDNVKVGDYVSIETENGDIVRFIVRRTEYYPFDNSPIAEIFGSNSGTYLNLITCAGTWNKATYSKRLVVYTEMVDRTLSKN